MDHDLLFKAIKLVILLWVAAISYMWYEGMFGKLWFVTFSNSEVWLILLLGAGWGAFKTIKEPQMTWPEWIAYVLIGSVISVPFIMLAYLFMTDLYNVEKINGYIAGAEHHEEYYTEREENVYDSDGKKTGTRTVRDYHPPKWYVLSSAKIKDVVQQTEITSSEYRAIVQLFGGVEHHKELSHLNEALDSDGDMYFTVWDKRPESMVPITTNHPYVDYLKASDAVTEVIIDHSGMEEYLKDYPALQSTSYGITEFQRVVVAGTSVPSSWVKKLDVLIDHRLMEIEENGKTMADNKQCNIVVYIAGTSDPGVRYALKQHWQGNAKNDIVVIIGSETFPKIDFCEVVCLMEEKAFETNLSEAVRRLRNLNIPPETLSDLICSHINKPVEQGGYLRLSMDSLAHLVVFIDLPWWGTVLMILLTNVIMLPFMIFMLNN